MDVEPSDGVPDMESVWQSGSGPLCFSRVVPMPALVLPKLPDVSGHRCIRPSMAECQAVRVSASKGDSGSSMQSKGERCPSPSHSPILALPDLILGADSPLVSAPLADSNQLQGRIWHPQPELWKLWVWPIQGQRPWCLIYLARFRRPSPVLGPPLLGSYTLPSGASLSPGVRFVQWTQLTALLVQCCSFCRRDWQQGRLLPPWGFMSRPLQLGESWMRSPWGGIGWSMHGIRRLRPTHPMAVPSWDLSVVLEGLVTAPFEPLKSAPERILTLKVTLLLALTSLKRVVDLQALSVSEMCMDFAPGLVKVTLRPRPDYIPKVLSTSFRSQVVTLHSFHCRISRPNIRQIKIRSKHGWNMRSRIPQDDSRKS